MGVNPGEVFVAGLDAATARRLLAAAEDAGMDPSVVRVDPGGGFVVPEALVAPAPAPAPKRKTTARRKTTTNKED